MIQVLARLPKNTNTDTDDNTNTDMDDTTALAKLCQDVLVQVCTTPHTASTHTTSHHNCNTTYNRWPDPWRRAVRVIQQLRLSNHHHYTLFETTTTTCAELSAALLMQGWTPHTLEAAPVGPTMQWLSAMHAMTVLVQRAKEYVVVHAGTVVRLPSGAGVAARRVLDTLLLPPAVASKVCWCCCCASVCCIVCAASCVLR